MERIVLFKGVRKKGKLWEVFLRGHRYTFKNKRKAEDFCRQVDTWLNDQFDQVNSTLVTVYGISRSMHKFQHVQTRSHVRNCIDRIETAIDLTLQRSDWENWTTIAFSKLAACTQQLLEAIELLQVTAQQKGYTIAKADLRTAHKMCQLMQADQKAFEVEAREYRRQKGQVFTLDNYAATA